MKPMLAGKAENLRFPLLASPKIDGIRALVKDGVLVSRNLKPIPNKAVQAKYGLPDYEGFDGELVVGSPTDPNCMQNTTSGVMSREGDPEVRYYIFDLWDQQMLSYRQRLDALEGGYFSYDETPHELGLELLTQTSIATPELLDAYEAQALQQGYEGVMVRDPGAPYKFGRSTAREGYLLKVKRFADSEAVILGFEELMKNQNELTKDELGHAKRSTHKEGLVPMNTLGALQVMDTKTGARFNIGGGFTAEHRREIWQVRGQLNGRIVTYKHFPGGVKNAPRFPVFKSFRDTRDIS